MRSGCFLLFLGLLNFGGLPSHGQDLPFEVVFKGKVRFDAIVSRASKVDETLKKLPIGERVVAFGRMMVGTPYKGFTLEVHDRIEAPVVNLAGLDCWTFFETALALARMSTHESAEWSPQLLRRYIEVDRYWGGKCTGSYLSRLHYLEDWASDNTRRGLVRDLTDDLGGIKVQNAACEMTINYQHYPYMKADAAVKAGIEKLEANLRQRPLKMIPKSDVPGIEARLQNGDVISIVTKDGAAYGTSHVGLALRQQTGVHFMHASAPRNAGKVIIDSRLTTYLNRFKSTAGIMVARPLK